MCLIAMVRPGLNGLCASLFLLALFHVGSVHAETANGLIAIPALKAPVTDLSNTLSAPQTQQLESELAALEQRKGSQLVVLIVPSTQPEAIEDYSIRVAEAWKIGRKSAEGKKVDDGVILLVAKNDHKLRIEVGYGLEGAITDVLAASIIRDYIAPRFRQNDFAGGIEAGTQALGKLIDGEALPPVWQAHQGAQQNHGDNSGGWLPAVFMAWFVAVFLRGIGGRLPTLLRGGLCGIAAAGVAWWAVGSLLIALVIGAGGLVFGLLASTGGALASRGGIGGFGGGSFGGGGGGGGGGFGGGGGSFGGGGASGSW
jgi:uncharacterized protein